MLEPIFEVDFEPCSYGFRPGRRAWDAIAEVRHFTARSYEWIVEADAWGTSVAASARPVANVRNWRWLMRRHLPGWRPTDDEVTLFNPAKVATTR